MKKRYFVLFIVVAVLLSSAAFAAKREPIKVLSYSIGGYSGDETALFSPADSDERGVKRFEISEAALSVSGEVDEVRRRRANDIVMALAYTPKVYGGGGGMTVSLDLTEKKIKLNDYSTFGFGVGVIGGFETNNAYSVHVELVTSDDTYLSDLTIEKTRNASGWYVVYVDLSDVYGYAEKLNVTVSFDGDTMPTQVRVSTPFVRLRAPEVFAIAEQYSAGSLTAVDGRLTGILGEVIPTEHGTATIKGRIVTPEKLKENTTAYFVVELDRVYSGNLSLSVEYTDSNKHGDYVSPKMTIDGEQVFTVPVRIDGEVLAYSLLFDDIECDEKIKLESVYIYSGGRDAVNADVKVGDLGAVTRKENSVKFEGTILRDAAKEYSDGSIVFYALPGISSGNMADAIELGRIKVSTRFEYTADLTSYPVSADTYMFMAAIIEDDTVIPLSSPRYFDSVMPEETTLSPIGLYGAAPAGAFESNASHIIVDVPLDLLFDTDEKASPYSLSYTVYGEDGAETKKVNLSASLIEELDRDVNFYISVGVRVYLRFVSSTPIEGLTYSGRAQNYGVRADTSEARSFYASTVKFIASRYGEIAGFVVGKAVNEIYSVGEWGAEDIRGCAEDLAELCRITYNAAAVYHSDISVIVPFTEASTSNGYMNDRVLGVMMADHLDKIGDIPWTIMYCIDDNTDDTNAPLALVRTVTELGLSLPHTLTYFYKPDSGELMRKYLTSGHATDDTSVWEGEFTRFAVESFMTLVGECDRASVVFLSLEDVALQNDRNFYSILKDASEAGGFIYEAIAVPAGDGADEKGTGVYAVWSFTDKHHTEGWIAGGGVASCLTGYSNIPDAGYRRVLKTQLAGNEYGGAGITLCNLDKTLDLTEVEEIDFTFALTRADGGAEYPGVSVVFVIGSDDYRAEFYAEQIVYGEMQTLSCDLSGYEQRGGVDYIGVMVYADDSVCFELSLVEACSLTLTSEELADVFAGVTYVEIPEDPMKFTAIVVVSILVAALTFIVVALLVRRDREERELRERESRQSESKSKRKAYERQHK